MAKFSGIASGSTPALTDTFLGVQGSNTDVQYTLAQLIAAISPAWTAYTPTITLNGLTGGGTAGNATVSGYYIPIGKLVSYYVIYTLGSTTNFTGLTSIDFTLPATLNSNYNGAFIGTGYAAISNSYLIQAQVLNTTSAVVVAQNAGSSYVFAANCTPTVPASWAAGNGWNMTGTYWAA